ncbi:MAG: hypothetical protein ACYC99_15045 [Candidatus Geothermincolia bacterium]
MDPDDRMKVLIVEDDEGMASLMGEVLERELLAWVTIAPAAKTALVPWA